MEEKLYTYWLNNIPGIGPATRKKLEEYAGSEKNIWSLTDKDLSAPHLALTASQAASFTASRDEGRISESYNKLNEKGIIFISKKDPQYPAKLRSIPDPPDCIYLKGRLPAPDHISVALVGARNCSEYGRYIARKLGESLGRSRFQVISGMARGIDCIGQKGAADLGGYTLAVLGCGVDICYPAENRELYDSLLTSGGILSEYPPGTQPRSQLFPRRNRIISGLSDVVVVIEAREKSGSLITADQALDQGKDVFAFPGRVTDPLSRGCNRLIRMGAGIILSPEDFIHDMLSSYSIPDEMITCQQLTLKNTIPLSEKDKKILSVLSLDPKGLTAIQSETGYSTGELTHALLDLCFRGLVVQRGSHYVKIPID